MKTEHFVQPLSDDVPSAEPDSPQEDRPTSRSSSQSRPKWPRKDTSTFSYGARWTRNGGVSVGALRPLSSNRGSPVSASAPSLLDADAPGSPATSRPTSRQGCRSPVSSKHAEKHAKDALVSAELDATVPPRSFRCFVSSYWPSLFNRASIIMVPIQYQTGMPAQPADGPGSLRVLCDLRNWRMELEEKQAYLMAYDADQLKAVALGCGMDARLASASCVALECLCAEKVPIRHSCEEVSIKLKPAFNARENVQVILRVVVAPKIKPGFNWKAIGDSVMVRLSHVVGNDDSCGSEKQLLTAADLIEKLCTWPDWWNHLPDHLNDSVLVQVLRTIRDAAKLRSIVDESVAEVIEKLLTFTTWWLPLSIRLEDDVLLQAIRSMRDAVKRRGLSDPPLERGSKVKLVRGSKRGQFATVLDPKAGDLVRVELWDGDRDHLVECFEPFELELTTELEEELYYRLKDLEDGLKEERLRRQEAEERARFAEETLDEERQGRRMSKEVRQDEDERLRAEEEMRKKREEEARVKAEEEEARRKAEEEEEARRKAEDDAARRQAEEDEEARRKAEEEKALREAEEEEAGRRAEEEARLRAEEEARLKAEAEEEARLRAEEEARLKALAEKMASRTRLRVRVCRAEHLRAADIGGSSDPYCVVRIESKRGDAANPPFKTDIKKKTLQPIWEQEHTFDACTLGDELLFEVFDHDDGKKDDALGSAKLSPSDFRPDGFDGWLELGEKKRRNIFGRSHTPTSDAKLHVTVEILPMVPDPERPRCFVTIVSANNLRAADRGGKSDPYCLCEVPGKPMSRFKTEVKKQTLSPEWNEEAEIQEFEKGDDLMFQVFDHDVGKSLGDALGSFTLSNMQFEPDGFKGEMTLSGKGARENSRVLLHVDIY